MPNSVAPGFIQIESTSIFGAHSAELPVNTITIDSVVPLDSTILAWDGSQIDWTVMVDALITELVDRYPVDYDFLRATLWSQPNPGDLPTFVATNSTAISGTVATPGWNKATQETITARDTGGYIVKLVLLDMASTNNFDPQVTLAGAGITSLWAEWSAITNGWSSRAGNRPSSFIKATRTLNEKLRKSYGMT
jgi:hypothetical protein